jgi:hypothetical protein
VWDPQSVCLSFLPSHLFPFLLNTASHRAASRRAAPAGAHDGTDGLPTRTHAEPGSAPRGLPRGKEPSTLPPPCLKRRSQPLQRRHVGASATPTNQSARRVHALVPLTGAYNPWDRAPLASQAALGFFPFPVCRRKKKSWCFGVESLSGVWTPDVWTLEA